MDGSFEFSSLYSPSRFFVGVGFAGSRDIFVGRRFEETRVALSDTTEIADNYLDNANARVISKIHGVQPGEDLYDFLKILPIGIPALTDTIFILHFARHTSDTFWLCDAQWKIFAPEIESVEFVPNETTLVIDESYSTYRIEFVNLTGVGEKPNLPTALDLLAYPNPFNGTVSLRIAIPENGKAKVEVYNLMGMKLGTLLDSRLNRGVYEVRWNGTTANGAAVGSGVYLFRLVSESGSKTVKGIYLK
jgi:hypothetical protein